MRDVFIERREFHAVGLGEMCQVETGSLAHGNSSIALRVSSQLIGRPDDKSNQTPLAHELGLWPSRFLDPREQNLVVAEDFRYPGILGPGRVRKRDAPAVVRMQDSHGVGITHTLPFCKYRVTCPVKGG